MAENINNVSPDNRISDQMARDICAAIYEGLTTGSRSRNNIASQSAMSDRVRSNNNSNGSPQPNRLNPYRRSKDPLGEFEDALQTELLNAVAGGDFKANINKALDVFAQSTGFELNELPGKLGKQLAKDALKSGLGQHLTDSLRNTLAGKGGLFDSITKTAGKKVGPQTQKLLSNMFSQLVKAPAAGAGDLAGAAVEATKGIEGLSLGGGELAGVVTEMSGAIGAALPEIALAVAAIAVVAKIVEPAAKGFADLLKALGAAAFKEDQMRAKRREAAADRLKADIEYMSKQPFEILTQAATEWYNTWDKNLRDISQTQGYDKESVYNLYSSYAERLRSEGLASVISSTSVIDNLDQVLKSGLSGKAAEEFAYVATKLNNAIPNQDFFQYAASYAQIAANEIARGASQASALDYATQQLEAFANNVLYANRELAGGFNTGLSNASQLFTDAVNIAETARTGNATAISGVLTSVSAVVGAVAPDLANGLVQNIVNAAIGGNNENIVALRSLAGINASNTEFLRAFAENPQEVFSNLFNKLAELQTMSNDNFMEVAEGLSPIFGVDSGALARVDFNYLARAISQMNINSSSLEDNLELLASGQSTTTAEQAKMAEINEMIVNDGLAIVLDNEAARVIQEHMWQEQQTVAITSATYAVDVQGALLSLIEGIAHTVTTIMRFTHPLDAIEEVIGNIAGTMDDSVEQREALNEILYKGAIKGNNAVLSNLINYSGTGPLDIFNEGINSANFEHLVTTRLSSMLFGPSGVSGGIYSSAASMMMDDIRNTEIPIGGIAGLVTGGGVSLDQLSGAAGGLAGMALSSYFSSQAPEGASPSDIGNAVAENLFTELSNPMMFNEGANSNAIKSQYGWGTVGKTSARFLAALSKNADAYAGKTIGALLSDETTSNTNKLKDLLDTLGTVNQAVANLDEDATTGKFATKFKDVVSKSGTVTYEDWVNSQFGDRDSYLEAISAYGTTEEAIKGKFQATEAKAAAVAEEARADAQFAFNQDARNVIKELRHFWDFESGTNGVYESAIWTPYTQALSNYWGYENGTYYDQFWKSFYDDGMKFDTRMDQIYNEMINERDNWIGDPANSKTVRGLLDTINTTLISFNESFDSWAQDWTDYYINHTFYTQRTSSADWNEMVNMEQATRDDTALALANALESISNIEDLKDPTVQSNVLLAKIVTLLEAIMQQNNSTGGLSLIDTFSAMSLGLTNRT